MPIDLYTQFQPELIAARWDAAYGNDVAYLYENWLPARRTYKLEMAHIRGEDDLPVTLEPSELDSDMIIRQRRVPRYENIEIPFFRESMIRNERDIVQLVQFFSGPTDDTYGAQEYLDRLLNDGARLIESSRVNREIMFNGLITDAGFTINGKLGTSNEGKDYVFNYDPDGTWHTSNVSTVSDWSDPTADILGDIQTLKRTIMLRGRQAPTTAIIGAETAIDLANNNTLKAMINTQVQVPVADLWYDVADYLSVLSRLTGITFRVYEKTYGDKNTIDANGIPAGQFYFPQRGTISFLPTRPIGNMFVGYTPEEIYYNNGSPILSGQYLNNGGGEQQNFTSVDGGIALCTKTVMAPAQATIWVAGFFAPSFQAINDVYVMNYTPAEGFVGRVGSAIVGTAEVG